MNWVLFNYCGGWLSGSVDIIFTGYDTGIEVGKVVNYQRSLNIQKDNILEDCLLVYEMNGQPLPKKHGFPLRLMVPDWYGMASVKYLKEIDFVPYRFR
jgi:DMSO/TMAO reductase YedYZ molybdopterin-dependent catalytic subunit